MFFKIALNAKIRSIKLANLLFSCCCCKSCVACQMMTICQQQQPQKQQTTVIVATWIFALICFATLIGFSSTVAAGIPFHSTILLACKICYFLIYLLKHQSFKSYLQANYWQTTPLLFFFFVFFFFIFNSFILSYMPHFTIIIKLK